MNATLKPNYPIEILPRISFKRELSVDSMLAHYAELLVVRMVEGNPDDYSVVFASGEKTLSDKVLKNNMANLSLHLAGGLFHIDKHLGFLPISRKAVRKWCGWYVHKDICCDKNSYTYTIHCFGLCFHVKDIHNRTFPFYRHFETVEERNTYAQMAAASNSGKNAIKDADFVGAFETKKKNVEVRPRIKIHHSPTQANYWHTTLDTYRPNESEYVMPGRKQNSADRNMFKALKQDLLQNYTINEQPAYRLKEKDYFCNLAYLISKIKAKGCI